MLSKSAVEKNLSLEIPMHIFIILLLLLCQVAGVYLSVIEITTSEDTFK
jgi:hypothetical protein